MTKIYNQYISLNNILLNQRLWICNCLYWRWQWSPDREEVRSPDAFHLELLRFMVGADVRLWERKISVWLSCWHLTPSTCSPSWRVTRGHIRGRAETPRGRRVEPTNPGDADGGTGAWLRCFIPNNLIIFNIITQPSWWSSSNLNQHVLVAEPLKVDHLIAKNYLVRFGLMKFSYVMSAVTFKRRSDSGQIRDHSSVVGLSISGLLVWRNVIIRW